MSANVEMNTRPAPDQVLVDIAKYVCRTEIKSTEAYDTARNCLIDTLGCGLLALRFPECTKHLGPLVPGTTVRNDCPSTNACDSASITCASLPPSSRVTTAVEATFTSTT